MIELLNNLKNIHKTSAKTPTKENVSTREVGTFQEQLDKSISQQKSLTEDLNAQKVEDTKKALKELNKKIQQMKDEVVSEEEIVVENPNAEMFVSLESIVSFLEQSLEVVSPTTEVEGVAEVTTDMANISIQGMSVDEWVSDMVVAIDQNLNHLEQVEGNVVFQKATFILEGVNIQNPNPQVEQSLMNVLTSIQQNVQQDIPLDIQQSEMVLDSIYKGFAEISEMEGEIKPLKNIADNVDVTSNIERFVKDEFNSDFQFDGQQSSKDQDNKKEQKFEITDLRTNNVATQTTPETLESIDNATTTINEVVQKNDVATIAERSYTSLSSSVSRVQVEALMQNVSGKVSIILQDGGNELRMKLTPPELGQMRLSFLTEDGMMRGKVIVETPEAKLLFEQNINNLRESLASVGIDLGSVDVELGNQGDFSEQIEQQNSLQAVRGNEESDDVDTTPIRRQLMDVLVDFTA